MFLIGETGIEPAVVSAPMSGISDVAYRQVAKKFGCGLVYTEMISADGLVRSLRRVERLVRFRPSQRPIAAQLVGAKPGVMAEAAAIVESLGFDLVDLNLGCSMPKVVRAGAGVSLMAEPKLLSQIISQVIRSVRIPVTVKMRAGQSRRTSPDCLFVAKLVSDLGAAAVCIHPRYGEDRFGGNADWTLIERVKSAVEVPVIGCGDIKTAPEAWQMMESTGCDGVMIGRAALGNPWLFGQTKALLNGKPEPRRPSLEEVGRTLLYHYSLLEQEYGESTVRRFRKFASWYSKRFTGSSRFRLTVNAVRDETAFRAAVQHFFRLTEGL